MRRALITTVGLAGLTGLAATAVPVLASPAAVDEGRTAGIQVTTKMPDGDTLRLDLSASELSTGSRLIIDTERCDSDGACVTKTYAGDLPAGAFTIASSDAQARLVTALDGRDLAISWKPTAQPGATMSTGTLEGDGVDNFFYEYSGSSADATVNFGAAGCQGVGGVGDGVVVDTAPVSGTEVARPLSALHLPDAAAIRC